MFSYLVAVLAVLLLLGQQDFLFQWISSNDRSHSPRARNVSPRPQLNESLLALDKPGDELITCSPDQYAVMILSREPLVAYIEGFLSLDERQHLLELSTPLFEPSTISADGAATTHNTTIRDSAVALIPRSETVRCIERRALAFQGWRRDVYLERLRTQKYVGPAGHYSHHFDWVANFGGWGRVSSFMVWVDDGGGEEAGEKLVGGGTEFPLLEVRSSAAGGGGRVCEIIECDGGREGGQGGAQSTEPENVDEYIKGVTFKPIPGNAVFWENFAPDGTGYEESWHAGLPVKQGVKVGLNIWSYGRIE